MRSLLRMANFIAACLVVGFSFYELNIHDYYMFGIGSFVAIINYFVAFIGWIKEN